MGHTGAVWCVDADCILVFPLSLMFSGSDNNGEAVDLEIGIWDAIVYPENDTFPLLPGVFTAWGNI